MIDECEMSIYHVFMLNCIWNMSYEIIFWELFERKKTNLSGQQTGSKGCGKLFSIIEHWFFCKGWILFEEN